MVCGFASLFPWFPRWVRVCGVHGSLALVHRCCVVLACVWCVSTCAVSLAPWLLFTVCGVVGVLYACTGGRCPWIHGSRSRLVCYGCMSAVSMAPWLSFTACVGWCACVVPVFVRGVHGSLALVHGVCGPLHYVMIRTCGDPPLKKAWLWLWSGGNSEGVVCGVALDRLASLNPRMAANRVLLCRRAVKQRILSYHMILCHKPYGHRLVLNITLSSPALGFHMFLRLA